MTRGNLIDQAGAYLGQYLYYWSADNVDQEDPIRNTLADMNTSGWDNFLWQDAPQELQHEHFSGEETERIVVLAVIALEHRLAQLTDPALHAGTNATEIRRILKHHTDGS